MKHRLAKICPLLPLVLILTIASQIFPQECPMAIDDITLKEHTDIRLKEFCLNLEPWKDGKLVTMDGWGRFSTFEITEKDEIKITPLVQFPKEQIDGWIRTYPEVEVIWSSIFELKHYFADIGDKKNVSFIPFITKVYVSSAPFLLDKTKKVFLIPYDCIDSISDRRNAYLIYDLQNDKILSHPMQPEKNENFYKLPVIYSFENGKLLVRMRDKNNNYANEYCMLDYYSGRTYKNKFTQFYSALRYPMIKKVSDENIFIISGMLKNEESLKTVISWNEENDDMTGLPLLLPTVDMADKNISVHYADKESGWVCFTIWPYEGLHGESLKKLGFVNIKKPSILSIPVATEEYYPNETPKGEFIGHPIYGTCFIEKIEKDGKDYIRLYKMSDVQAEIDRILLEKAKSVVK